MTPMVRTLLVLGLLLTGVSNVSNVRAQQVDASTRPYDDERSLIESALQTVIAVIQEATFQETGHSISERLRLMTAQLDGARQTFQPRARPAAAPVTDEDLRRLETLLRDLHAQLRELRQALEAEQNVELANRLAPIERGLFGAVETVQTLADGEPGTATVAEGERWLRPGRYEGGDYEPAPGDDDRRVLRQVDRRQTVDRRVDKQVDTTVERVVEGASEGASEGVEAGIEGAAEGIEAGIEGAAQGIEGAAEGIEGAVEGIREGLGWGDDWNRRRTRRHRRSFGPRGYPVTVGDLTREWPYGETALYRPIPAIRYNRVEGLVLGVGFSPPGWYEYDRHHVYGQVGYAFALDEWRYEAGFEALVGRSYDSDFNLKLGGNYHHNTATDDLWKSGWLENSLAAFLFKNDFFDYYEIEGWTVYAVQQLSAYTQLSAGYRFDDYRSLDNHTNWALFGGNDFRFNPGVDEGDMHSLVFAFEGGRVGDMDYLPRGIAFRVEAEVGDGLGGDFAFNRYLGDVRAYVPVSRQSTLSLRLRGGLADGDEVPVQKQFSIGGIGSVRGYPQNVFFGTRMLLGNVEYAFDEVSLFDGVLDEVQFFGFADAGWVNDRGTDTFDFDHVYPAAGLGVGLDDRFLRLELAWPLRDLGQGHSPTLWLRLNPTF